MADLSFPDSTTRRGRVQEGGDVCPTLMAGEQDICRIEKADNGVLEMSRVDADGCYLFQSEMFGGVNVQPEKVSTTIKATKVDCGCIESYNNTEFKTQYRIRKLTPRECYRLMAVPEKDIDKMLEVNSATQCYKQAGNSIVVNCLIAIFSQMGIQGIPRWNEGLSEKYK